MATNSNATPVEARVLVSCAFGKPDEVVTLDADTAQAGQDAGQLDTNADAVAYAKALAAQVAT
jgi:hypothetical protein